MIAQGGTPQEVLDNLEKANGRPFSEETRAEILRFVTLLWKTGYTEVDLPDLLNDNTSASQQAWI